MVQDDIYLMISKYFSGEITTEEEKKLQAWIRESGENQQLFAESSRIWDLSGNMKLELDLNRQQAWQRIQDQTRSRPKRFRISTMAIRVAASLLVLLVAGGLIFLLQTGKKEYIHQTTSNQQHHLVLPDNSKVWLNEDSRLSYSDDFGMSRKLQLIGEAYFEVVSDPSRPFSVQTPHMLTTVVGTSFTITAPDGKPIEEVVVTSGKVKVSVPAQDHQPLFLEPGTRVSYNLETGDLKKSPNNDMNFLAWKERKLSFRNTPLSQLARDLEQYFEIKISFEHQNLGDCLFTSEFPDPTLEEVMQELAITLDISYTLKDGKYFLTGTGCK